MKFAHLADCHIGGWREPKMRDVSLQAFVEAVDICIKEGVDFVLIAGDLFNTAIPAIDNLKTAVQKLRDLKDNNIPVYMIAGSHDFSPSGRTMIDVLETADLIINVVKGTVVDEKLRLNFTKDKTGVKITGMLGKRGALEKSHYEDLDRTHLEKEEGFKIFMFHSAITEMKTKELEQMESAPISLLPKGFDYYAGGHVHIRKEYNDDNYKNVIYPGPLFPNSFSELEKLEYGSFYIYDNTPKLIPLKIHPTVHMDIKGDSVEDIELQLKTSESVNDAIVTIRVRGKLDSGRISDIDFKGFTDKLYQDGAYMVMKNTAGLKVADFDEVKIHEDSVDNIEKNLMKEHLEDKAELGEKLLTTLSQSKNEGEKNYDFQDRIKNDVDKLLGV